MISAEKVTQGKEHIIDQRFQYIPKRTNPAELVRNFANQLISQHIQVTYTGEENIHALKEGGILSVFPHTSHVDTVAVIQMLRQWAKNEGTPQADALIAQVAFLAAADYWFPEFEPNPLLRPLTVFKNTVAQSVIRMLPMVRKASGSKSEQRQSIDSNLQAISHYISIGGITPLYVNGTRIKPNIPVAKQEIKAGLGSLALMIPHMPIVPAILKNSTEIWPKGTFLPRLNKDKNQVHITLGEPIYITSLLEIPQDDASLSSHDRSRLRKIVNKLLLEKYIALESQDEQT